MDCKVYVGDIKDATEKDLDRAFSAYGRLKSVWVARNPSGFAFVEFEDPRDAEDAVRGMDGKKIGTSRVRVEAATGKTKSKPWMRGGDRGGDRDRDRDRDRDSYRERDRDRDYRGGSSRGPPSRGRRPFNPDDKCYECGRRGHYAYDCPQYLGRRDNYRKTSRYSRSRSRSRSPVKRSYSRSRSRSPRRSSRRTRSRSNSRSRSRSHSPEPRRRSAGETAEDRHSEDR